MSSEQFEFFGKKVFEHFELLERLAGKRFPDETVAQEASSYVMEKLREDDWRRARAYQGKARFKTYICVVARRLLEDFSRSMSGRLRIPKWVRDRGDLWTRIWRMLCMERLSADDVTHSLEQGNLPVNVEAAISEILATDSECGKQMGDISCDNPDELKPDPVSLHQLSPDDFSFMAGRMSTAQTLVAILSNEIKSLENGKMKELAEQFQSLINLGPEESLFLRMVYEEDLPVSEAGRALGWKTNQASGKHRRLMKRIRKAVDETNLPEKLGALSLGN